MADYINGVLQDDGSGGSAADWAGVGRPFPFRELDAVPADGMSVGAVVVINQDIASGISDLVDTDGTTTITSLDAWDVIQWNGTRWKRIGNIEDNPLTTLTVSGDDLTATLKDGTTIDVTLPSPHPVEREQKAESLTFVGSTSDDAESADIELAASGHLTTEYNVGVGGILEATAGATTFRFLRAGIYFVKWSGTIDLDGSGNNVSRNLPSIRFYSGGTLSESIDGHYERGGRNNRSNRVLFGVGVLIVPANNTDYSVRTINNFPDANDGDIDPGQKLTFYQLGVKGDTGSPTDGVDLVRMLEGLPSADQFSYNFLSDRPFIPRFGVGNALPTSPAPRDGDWYFFNADSDEDQTWTTLEGGTSGEALAGDVAYYDTDTWVEMGSLIRHPVATPTNARDHGSNTIYQWSPRILGFLVADLIAINNRYSVEGIAAITDNPDTVRLLTDLDRAAPNELFRFAADALNIPRRLAGYGYTGEDRQTVTLLEDGKTYHRHIELSLSGFMASPIITSHSHADFATDLNTVAANTVAGFGNTAANTPPDLPDDFGVVARIDDHLFAMSGGRWFHKPVSGTIWTEGVGELPPGTPFLRNVNDIRFGDVRLGNVATEGRPIALLLDAFAMIYTGASVQLYHANSAGVTIYTRTGIASRGTWREDSLIDGDVVFDHGLRTYALGTDPLEDGQWRRVSDTQIDVRENSDNRLTIVSGQLALNGFTYDVTVSPQADNVVRLTPTDGGTFDSDLSTGQLILRRPSTLLSKRHADILYEPREMPASGDDSTVTVVSPNLIQLTQWQRRTGGSPVPPIAVVRVDDDGNYVNFPDVGSGWSDRPPLGDDPLFSSSGTLVRADASSPWVFQGWGRVEAIAASRVRFYNADTNTYDDTYSSYATSMQIWSSHNQAWESIPLTSDFSLAEVGIPTSGGVIVTPPNIRLQDISRLRFDVSHGYRRGSDDLPMRIFAGDAYESVTSWGTATVANQYTKNNNTVLVMWNYWGICSVMKYGRNIPLGDSNNHGGVFINIYEFNNSLHRMTFFDAYGVALGGGGFGSYVRILAET